MRRSILLLTAAAVAVTPAAAQRRVYLNPQDVAEAQREHAQVVQELGGAETGPRAAYVEIVGRRVGAYSGVANPAQALHFTTLNSAVENAFSVPGGYVYVTRQLMSLDGRRVGARLRARPRSRPYRRQPRPYSRAICASAAHSAVLGQIIGAIFGGSHRASLRAGNSDLLSFSREQEYQADRSGMRYMIAAGYDPAGAPGLLAALSRQSALQARVQGRTNRQTPEWASTHPLSENRMQRALQLASATGRLGTGMRNRDMFLSELEGIFVDDDPAQGVIDGASFTHPDLRIQFSVPPGYLMSNGTYAVTISGSAGKAQFSGGRYSRYSRQLYPGASSDN